MCKEKKEAVYAALDELGISYELWEHPAVYTIEEMLQVGLPHPEQVVKNLFLRDAKGRRHFLVVVPGEKQVDLRALGERLGAGKLSFASEERLQKYLGLERGSVTPLGVLNDSGREVTVVLDEALRALPRVAVHPNHNTATVALALEDLVRVIQNHGNPLTFVEV